MCMVTKDSAGHVEGLLRSLKSFADEVVIAVDASSTDDTERICARYADKLFRIEPIGLAAPALSWLHRQASCDWVMRIDDDELPSVGFVEALPRMMADREVTHYWMRVRWMFGEGGDRYITQHPWWPEWKLRLHRNIPSIFHVPPVVHTRVQIQGASRYFYEGSIYHYDLLIHSEEWRRRKAQQRYEARDPGKGLGHFYVPEDISPQTAPIPEDDLPLVISEKSGWRDSLGKRIGLGRATPQKVSFDEIKAAAMYELKRGPGLFKANLEVTEWPETMEAGGWYPVDMRVRNDSTTIWPFPGTGSPEVRVGYHWLCPDGEVHEFGGHRTEMPHTMKPGQQIRMPASVKAPEQPGDYTLQFDLAMKDVNWFSKMGWKCPSNAIRLV